jgi:hypothetical protein
MSRKWTMDNKPARKPRSKSRVAVTEIATKAKSAKRSDKLDTRMAAKYKGGITGQRLIDALGRVVNLDAVVCLCEEGFGYSAITEIIDETQEKDGDGVVGNILLKLEPQSEIDRALNQVGADPGESNAMIMEYNSFTTSSMIDATNQMNMLARKGWRLLRILYTTIDLSESDSFVIVMHRPRQ